MNFLTRLFNRKTPASQTVEAPGIRLACGADLWCRKRTSISTMLDPDLFALYMTGDDRIDEDWVIQSNPPCAFKIEFKEGCDALWELLQIDSALHATKGWIHFMPPPGASAEMLREYEAKLQTIVRTAQRELKIG